MEYQQSDCELNDWGDVLNEAHEPKRQALGCRAEKNQRNSREHTKQH